MASQRASSPGGRPDRPADAAKSARTGGAEEALGTARSPRSGAGRHPDGNRRSGDERGADRARRGPTGEEWADEAARARSASDPRRIAPHDAAGVPSTGDTR